MIYQYNNNYIFAPLGLEKMYSAVESLCMCTYHYPAFLKGFNVHHIKIYVENVNWDFDNLIISP